MSVRLAKHGSPCVHVLKRQECQIRLAQCSTRGRLFVGFREFHSEVERSDAKLWTTPSSFPSSFSPPTCFSPKPQIADFKRFLLKLRVSFSPRFAPSRAHENWWRCTSLLSLFHPHSTPTHSSRKNISSFSRAPTPLAP